MTTSTTTLPIRNHHPMALMGLAAAASYLLGFLVTVGFERVGLGDAYITGFVLTGMAVAIAWALVHAGIIVPVGRACSAFEDGDAAINRSGLREHKIVGPLIEKVLMATHAFLKTVGTISQIIERNSVTLAETSHRADTLNKGIKALADKGAKIAASSQSIAATSAQVSSSASVAAESAQRAQNDSRSGQQALQETIAEMRNMASRTQTASTSIGKLKDSSMKIEEIVRVIGEVADQINLLALNAAIEAARAGEHGRGFAVVADEVRKLAEKTTNATKEISGNVAEIIGETDQAVTTMGSLLVDVQKGVAQIERVGKRLQGILDFSNTLSDHMQGIVQAAEQSAGEVESISTRLAEMQDELGEFERQMGSISKQSMELCELGEGMHEQLADLDLDTIHGRMFKVAQAAAAEVRKVFEEAVATGKIGESDLFDRNYRPIASTNPQKYNSRFDSFTDRTLPAIQERVLATHPEIIYAICTDDKGYVPTHNDKFAKPPTGNYEVDLINSRSKRVFNDRTGSRCGSHTRKMLLQTYKRDTGEIMHDLSVPIHIGGRHWGGFRMGYKAA